MKNDVSIYQAFYHTNEAGKIVWQAKKDSLVNATQMSYLHINEADKLILKMKIKNKNCLI